MILVRILEKKETIRFFGTALIIAPFANILLMMSYVQGVPHPWNLSMFLLVAKSLSMPNKILSVMSILIGILTLNGSKSAWKLMLGLLGGYIALQVSIFDQILKAGWKSASALLVNIAVFIFIADQLVWKTNLTPLKKRPVPPPVPKSIVPTVFSERQRRVQVNFASIGWKAQLLEINSIYLKTQSLAESPSLPSDRSIELAIDPNLKLKLKFLKQEDSFTYFQMPQLPEEQIQRINLWLMKESR